jgi:hypothetical protein
MSCVDRCEDVEGGEGRELQQKGMQKDPRTGVEASEPAAATYALPATNTAIYLITTHESHIHRHASAAICNFNDTRSTSAPEGQNDLNSLSVANTSCSTTAVKSTR